MQIISSKQIDFLVSNIFEKYYEPVHTELKSSGLPEELVYKTKQDILSMIYRRAMEEGVTTEEEFDNMAVSIINERLESVLVPYFAQKYIEKYALDKEIIENGMLLGIADNVRKEENINSAADNAEENSSKEEAIACEEVQTEPTAYEEVQTETTACEEVSAEEIKKTENPKPAEDIVLWEDATEIMNLTREEYDTPVIRRMEEPRIRRFRINWVLTIGISLFLSLVLWFLLGLLMGNGYIPRVDLGYTWFNSHIWRVF